MPSPQSVAPPLPNVILKSLSPDTRKRLQPVESKVSISKVLFDSDTVARDVFFPEDGCVVSLIREMTDGTTVEVGLVGFEGVAPIYSILAAESQPDQAVVQNEGRVWRVTAERLRTEMATNEGLRNQLLRYAAAFMAQLSQNSVCNRLHSIEQRLAKWLLIMRDRTNSDDLHLTHEFLAHMLGIRRSGVSIAVGELSGGGLIRHARGRVTIMNLEALQERACECAGILRDVFTRSLQGH
jgi:CRP-like cAMP-binding protein